MPTYRGIHQVDIVASIRDARALLSAYSSGPALDAHLAKVSDAAITAIADAPNDAALASAIKNSNIEHNMLWISDLLRFHAEADTDGKGLDIYKSLAKWGALSGSRSAILSAVDSEIKDYIATQPPEILISAKFNAANVKTEIASVTPFKGYVIEIDGMRDGYMYSTHPAIESMCDEIQRKFGDDPEFKRVMAGVLTTEKGTRHGIVFMSTATVALKVADLYPMFTLFSSNGAVIPPAAKRNGTGNTPKR